MIDQPDYSEEQSSLGSPDGRRRAGKPRQIRVGRSSRVVRRDVYYMTKRQLGRWRAQQAKNRLCLKEALKAAGGEDSNLCACGLRPRRKGQPDCVVCHEYAVRTRRRPAKPKLFPSIHRLWQRLVAVWTRGCRWWSTSGKS
jgi:hypothetical protein